MSKRKNTMKEESIKSAKEQENKGIEKIDEEELNKAVESNLSKMRESLTTITDKSLKHPVEEIELERKKLEEERKALKEDKQSWENKLNLLRNQKEELDAEIEQWESKRKEIRSILNNHYIEMEKDKAEAISKLKQELAEKYKEFENYQKTEEDYLRKKIKLEFEKEKEKLRLREAGLEAKEKCHQEQVEDLNRKVEEYRRNVQKLKEKEDNLNKDREAFNIENEDIEFTRRKLEHRDKTLKRNEADFYRLIEEAIDEKEKLLRADLTSKDQEIERLVKELSEFKLKQISIDNYRNIYGDDLENLQRKVASLENENTELRDEKSNLVKPEQYYNLKAEHEGLREEFNRLAGINSDMSLQIAASQALKSKNIQLEQRLNYAQEDLSSKDNRIEELNQRLKRYETPKSAADEREARIAAIQVGILGKHAVQVNDEENYPGNIISKEESIDPNIVDNRGMCLTQKDDYLKSDDEFDSRYSSQTELEWLDNVMNACENFGVHFDKRIFYAFHTALKIQDWSIITVLAGVSGTGKSELPKLYAAFGGFNFCAVPVQPNWDSQESMLGFFNSIDNKFEPEDVLRFLAQCTESQSPYSEYMSIVLLDEMNLAHVEYYFAEFLSKLETRRTQQREDLPSVAVKLGAGIEPYRLKMKRNVVWVGTMNQDETTKSLSDKVLDRGVIINFPRPTELVRRKKMPTLIDEIKNMEKRPKMHQRTFLSWVRRDLDRLSDAQRNELDCYKKIVESINTQLDGVGRALGHRVWQSIEFYIVNYPTVSALLKQTKKITKELKKEMRIAFEDQIVQKIMPKLRGIDTRDKKGRHSLEEIKRILIENGFTSMQEDFEIACEQGYGQFMWNSAKYLSYIEEAYSDVNELE